MKSPVRDILSAAGPVARHLGPAFEPRPEQLEMADAVSRAMAAKANLLVEAGTGVGKSFAYLVPAMLRCLTTGERVVVATHTIALQEQLVRRDIPTLIETLGAAASGEVSGVRVHGEAHTPNAWGIDPAVLKPLNPVLVKGRGNYVSIRRLKQASDRQDRLFLDEAQRRTLHVIEDWATGTADGSLATLPALERPGVWDRVQSDTDNCMGRKCPHYDACFYQASRRAMEQGNLLICNHALFFADLSMRREDAGFLPPYDHVILDEAHNVEDVACDHFGLNLSEGRVDHLLNVLYHAGTGKGYIAHAGCVLDKAGNGGAVDAAGQAVIEAQGVSRAFFEALLAVHRSGRLRNGRIAAGAAVVDVPLAAAMQGLAARLRLLKDVMPGDADKFELNAYALRADAIAADAEALVAQALPGCVYWLEVSGGEDEGGGWRGGGRGRGSRQKITLACAPIEVGPLLKHHLFGQNMSVTLTSATLATTSRSTPLVVPPATPAVRAAAGAAREDARRFVAAEDEDLAHLSTNEPLAAIPASAPGVSAAAAASPFAHCTSRLGCEDAQTLLLGSPFDYAAQARVIVDLSVPSPRATVNALHTERADYARALAQRALAHLDATRGGAFVLFTSFDLLNRFADELAGPLAGRGFPLVVQGRDGPAATCLERFRGDERSVLLGAASFWQGVDVKGHGLRNVIITRLPFDPPDRPIVEARNERITARGGDPFKEDALPRAILRFKQGFGRLIRSKTDRGQVVILDPRVNSVWYGRKFLEALPPGVNVEKQRARALDE